MNVDIISVLDMVAVQMGVILKPGVLWYVLADLSAGGFFCKNVILSVIKQANVALSDARIFTRKFD